MRRSLLDNKDSKDEERRRRRVAFFLIFLLFTLMVISIVLPLTTNRGTSPIVCDCPVTLNYSFDYSPCNNCGKCITFLNNSLYYLTGNSTQSFILPFSIVNGTAVYGVNQINNQTLQNVYGCGRKDDTTIYVSSDTFALSTVSTVSQNQTNLFGGALYSRGFALVDYVDLYRIQFNPNLRPIIFNNVTVSNLTLFANTCVPLRGFGLSWDPITKETFVIYSRSNNNRHIGHVNLTSGLVKPTCINITRSFQSMEFDSTGRLWTVVGNGGQDASKLFSFSKAPCILTGNVTCTSFGTLRGTEIFGDGSRYGNPTKMSGDGSTIIAGSAFPFTQYASVHRYYQNEWYQLGNQLNEPLTAAAISENGDIIAIGDANSNHTRVYRIENCTWVQIGSDVSGGGYAVSLSPDGLTLASSLINDITVNTSAGRTYVHDWNGTSWNVRGSPIEGVAAFDYSGFDISLYGKNRLAIGIIEFTGVGRTEVYEWNGSAWVQLGASIVGENFADNSGNSVSLQNNTLAIGAWQNDGNGTDSGSTRVYHWNGTQWNQLGQDIDGELANDYSGAIVSLSANGLTVAIGAIFNPIITENGQVRIYDYNGTVWIQRGYDIDGVNFAQAGICSMSNDATSVAVGGPRKPGGGTVNVYCLPV